MTFKLASVFVVLPEHKPRPPGYVSIKSLYKRVVVKSRKGSGILRGNQVLDARLSDLTPPPFSLRPPGSPAARRQEGARESEQRRHGRQ